MTEDRVDENTAEMDKLIAAEENYLDGYRAGYEAAKKEVLERMKKWLGEKEDKSDGEDKNHEKAPG